MNSNTIINNRFVAFIDSANLHYDKQKAKRFAIKNWGNLTNENKRLFDWVFGKESRMPNIFLTPKAEIDKIKKAEDKLFNYMEEDGIYD